MSKNVLITGMGGIGGQGILRNIIHNNYDIRLVGTNTEAVSGGNHLCDAVYKVPIGYSSLYIPKMQKICEKERIDLIIPSTDYEAYYLAKSRDKLPLLAASDADVAFTFLNKYKTWQALKKFSIPFAETRLPSEYKNEFKEIIVKPIEGRGSRDIHINPPNAKAFSADYIIQKLYKGTEITTAFYVTKKGKLLGHITMERVLYSGLTKKCEVVFKYDKKIREIIRRIMDNLTIRGSCNIQSIVKKNGEIVPFEVNCRISGTNSVRAHFGFEDVKYTIQEYLYGETPVKPTIRKGAAARLLVDVIYPDIGLGQIKNKSTKHYLF